MALSLPLPLPFPSLMLKLPILAVCDGFFAVSFVLVGVEGCTEKVDVFGEHLYWWR